MIAPRSDAFAVAGPIGEDVLFFNLAAIANAFRSRSDQRLSFLTIVPGVKERLRSPVCHDKSALIVAFGAPLVYD